MQANVRTFRAETPRAALAAVKRALGPEAVILATRELKAGLLSKGGVEVIAAPPAPAASEPAPAPKPTKARAEANKASSEDPAREALRQALRERIDPLGPTEKTEIQTQDEATRAMLSRRARAAFGTRRRPKASKKRKSEPLLSSSDEIATALADNPFSMPALRPPEGTEELAPFEAAFFAPPMGLDEAYGAEDDLDGVDGDIEDEIADDAMEALAVALGVPLQGTTQAASIERPASTAAHAQTPQMTMPAPQPPRPDVGARVARRLQKRGISDELAQHLVEAARMGHEDSTAEQLILRIGRRVRENVQVARAPWSPDATGHRDVIALIGPTGVGKTTTIAKIAASAIMEFSLKVALITVDTYRIGAAHQLARYGELLGAPTFVARDRNGLSQAMERSQSADLVLIDTAGRSSSADVASQASLIQSIADVQMHLVVSATSSKAHLARVKERFAVADAERIVVTKLDEGDGPASFLDPVVRMGLPLSCVTMGQRVPEDIEALSPAAIVDKVVG